MGSEAILKKDGVRLVRKRLNELLKPRGFQKQSTNRFIRVREHFIDLVELDTAGYHLDPLYHIYYRPAPFTRLHCDMYRLWRTAQMDRPYWSCKIPPNGGPYFYEPKHFETVWQEVSGALDQLILPQMETMTAERFLSKLLVRSQDDRDLFLAYNTVFFNDLYFTCMSEAAVYGVGMWGLEQYEEGIPYLTFAQQKYRAWMEGHEQETSHFYRSHALTLELLNRLLTPYQKNRPRWTTAAQKKISQVAIDWADYML